MINSPPPPPQHPDTSSSSTYHEAVSGSIFSSSLPPLHDGVGKKNDEKNDAEEANHDSSSSTSLYLFPSFMDNVLDNWERRVTPYSPIHHLGIATWPPPHSAAVYSVFEEESNTMVINSSTTSSTSTNSSIAENEQQHHVNNDDEEMKGQDHNDHQQVTRRRRSSRSEHGLEGQMQGEDIKFTIASSVTPAAPEQAAVNHVPQHVPYSSVFKSLSFEDAIMGSTLTHQTHSSSAHEQMHVPVASSSASQAHGNYRMQGSELHSNLNQLGWPHEFQSLVQQMTRYVQQPSQQQQQQHLQYPQHHSVQPQGYAYQQHQPSIQHTPQRQEQVLTPPVRVEKLEQVQPNQASPQKMMINQAGNQNVGRQYNFCYATAPKLMQQHQSQQQQQKQAGKRKAKQKKNKAREQDDDGDDEMGNVVNGFMNPFMQYHPQSQVKLIREEGVKLLAREARNTHWRSLDDMQEWFALPYKFFFKLTLPQAMLQKSGASPVDSNTSADQKNGARVEFELVRANDHVVIEDGLEVKLKTELVSSMNGECVQKYMANFKACSYFHSKSPFYVRVLLVFNNGTSSMILHTSMAKMIYCRKQLQKTSKKNAKNKDNNNVSGSAKKKQKLASSKGASTAITAGIVASSSASSSDQDYDESSEE